MQFHSPSLSPTIQLVFDPAKSATVQAMSSQLVQENAVRDSIEGFTEVQVDSIHSLSFIYEVGHLVIKRNQVGQAGPAFPKPLLAGPDTLVVLNMPCDGTEDDLFYNLPQHSTDSPSDPSGGWVSCRPTSSHLGPPRLARTDDKWGVAWRTPLPAPR
ncbi:hypothetical protein BTVI_109728 [Pitangus sulphuratus]|nr:hypothetical protein BTVI_109728 [Pitangus sulphuratus]